MEKFIDLLIENMWVFAVISILIALSALISLVLVIIKQKKLVKENKIKEEEKAKEKLIEQNKAKLELEEMVKQMEEDLNNQVENPVSSFEQEQEEKAIISYQELVSSVKGELTNTTKLNIDEILSELENESLEESDESIDLEPEEINDSKFKSTEFISPVFGKQESKLNYPKIEEFGLNKECEQELFEKDIDVDELDEQIKRNDEFLKALKEFRNNL